MRRIVCLVLLVFCIPSILCAQDKVDIPIWNVGDKWVLKVASPYLKMQGTIEVVGTDQNTYTVEYSGDICIAETQGFTKILFEPFGSNSLKSSLVVSLLSSISVIVDSPL